MNSPDPRDTWKTSTRSSVGPKPEYSRESIVAAALHIADTEGLNAVSIRRVATEIGSGAASLYRYLKSREELIELMIDSVSGEYVLETSQASAHEQLLDLALQARRIMYRHRWLAPLLLTNPTMGPNALAYLNFALGALKPLKSSGSSKLQTVAMLTAITSAFVQNELATQTPSGQPLPHAEERLRYLVDEAHSGKYPEMLAVLENLGPEESNAESFRRVIITYLNGAGVHAQP